MKHDPTHRLLTSEEWDKNYKLQGSIWTTMQKGELERVAECLELIGDAGGRTFLDLGGGPLMVKALFDAGADKLRIVDLSAEACTIARRIDERTEVVVGDAMEYLQTDFNRFDVTICMGLLQVVPPPGLNVLLSRCPSDDLVLSMPVCEGYLTDYPHRIVVYSMDDVESACKKHRWEITKRHPSAEHLNAKLQKIRRRKDPPFVPSGL